MNGDVEHRELEPPSLPRKVNLARGKDGYGFNLHGEKGIHGQFISAIDEGSPAQLNDVRVGDRVIAVNNEDVEDLPHSKVVERIRAGGNTVTLLVVDEQCDQFYKNRGTKIPQDKYECPNEPKAVPQIIESTVNGEEEEVQEQNGEVTESSDIASPAEVPEEKPVVEEAEATTEDGNEYEEVIPKVSNEPEESEVEKPVETSETTPQVAPVETPSNVWEQQQQDETTTSPAPEQTPTIQPTDTVSSPSDKTTSHTSPVLDMAAARPKPKRNEVKRATQNWKQKYDDFNKL